MKRRRERVVFNYECSLSGEAFTLTEKAPNPKDLVTIKAYYELNPEMDDRSAVVKKKLGIEATPETKH